MTFDKINPVLLFKAILFYLLWTILLFPTHLFIIISYSSTIFSNITTTMALFNKDPKSFIKLISIICFLQISALNGQLRVGFYSESCHNVESIVSSMVKEASQREPRMPAILLRLHFHDCFVQVLSYIFNQILVCQF